MKKHASRFKVGDTVYWRSCYDARAIKSKVIGIYYNRKGFPFVEVEYTAHDKSIDTYDEEETWFKKTRFELRVKSIGKIIKDFIKKLKDEIVLCAKDYAGGKK